MTQQENGPRGEGRGQESAGHEVAGAARGTEDLTVQEPRTQTAAHTSPGTDRPELEEGLERVSGTEGCD